MIELTSDLSLAELHGRIFIPLSLIKWFLCVFQVMSVHLNHWKLDRRLGLGLMFLYAIFLLCSILFGQMWDLKVKGQHAEYLPFYHTSSFLKPKKEGGKNMTAFYMFLVRVSVHLCRIHSRSTVQTTTRKHNEVSVASSSPFGPVLCY